MLSAKWRDLRGLEIVSFGVSSVNASKEDEQMIKYLQKSAVMRDPTMTAATLVGAQADAMKAAAANQGASPAMAFMGMNMAGSAGDMSAQNLFAMGQQQPAPASAPAKEIKEALMQVRKSVREGVVAANVLKSAQTCPLCGATTTPDASGRCEYCGRAVQG